MRRLPAALALAALLVAAPARAATQASWTATVDSAAGSVWAGVTGVFEGLFGWLWPSPSDLAGPMARHDRFWSLVGTAGYGVKQFRTSLGLIPSASASFQLIREMSEADCDELDRQLAAFEQEERGPVARFQRMVLTALVDAQSASAYKVDRLEVSLLPLPQATFYLAPRHTVMSEEHDALLRAIESLKGHFQ
jgi:hypothetical protein